MMKTKAARARRTKGKGGGESPCKTCKPVKFTPARDRNGRFKPRGRK